MRKIIMAYMIHIAIVLIAFLGLWEKYEWAQNILIFYIWLRLIISTIIYLAIIASEDYRKDAAVKKELTRSIGSNSSIAFDITVMLSLIIFGWFWTASALCISVISQHGIYDGIEKEIDNLAKKGE